VALARLHGETLPDSLVSALGPLGLRCYYDFVRASPEELLLTIEHSCRLAGALVFSFHPQSLMKRFFAANRATLMGLILLRLPVSPRLRRFLSAKLFQGRPAAEAQEVLPELVQIYVAGGSRRQGLGAELLAMLDARLRDHGVERYAVKTEDEPDNPAVDFYHRQGYVVAGRLQTTGKSYLCFVKRLEA
jgi:GNAT superfamily N-acetyltransferase